MALLHLGPCSRSFTFAPARARPLAHNREHWAHHRPQLQSCRLISLHTLDRTNTDPDLTRHSPDPCALRKLATDGLLDVLVDPGTAWPRMQLRALASRLQTVKFKDKADIPNALEAVMKERPDALYNYPDPLSNSERRQIAEFALKHRLPSMHAIREYVEAGGLMSYGASTPEMFKLMANQVAQILDGAKAGDVPLLQATRFELVINLKTAKALGLTIPPSILGRADQVIDQ